MGHQDPAGQINLPHPVPSGPQCQRDGGDPGERTRKSFSWLPLERGGQGPRTTKSLSEWSLRREVRLGGLGEAPETPAGKFVGPRVASHAALASG